MAKLCFCNRPTEFFGCADFAASHINSRLVSQFGVNEATVASLDFSLGRCHLTALVFFWWSEYFVVMAFYDVNQIYFPYSYS